MIAAGAQVVLVADMGKFPGTGTARGNPTWWSPTPRGGNEKTCARLREAGVEVVTVQAGLRTPRPPATGPTGAAEGVTAPAAGVGHLCMRAARAVARISSDRGESFVARARTSAPSIVHSRTMPSSSSVARNSAKAPTPSA